MDEPAMCSAAVCLCVFLKYSLEPRICSWFWYVIQIKFSPADQNQI